MVKLWICPIQKGEIRFGFNSICLDYIFKLGSFFNNRDSTLQSTYR